MKIEDIRRAVLAIPEVAAWPEVVKLVERPTRTRGIPCWDYPTVACRAVGGEEARAAPGGAAIFCLLYSIHLVDDLLDEDPSGVHHDLGVGTTANVALALQAASSAVIERAGLPAEQRAAIHAALAQTALATAYGQNLDASSLASEEDYWRVVENKTPPLFSAGLAIGAVLGGAPEATVRGLADLGFILGKSIQISDDLKDALEKPARPDWKRRWNNLPILYGMTAEHPQRTRFLDLLERIDELPALEEAQEILVRSGAVSFCTYHMVELHRAAQTLLQSLDLPCPAAVAELLEDSAQPLKGLFRSVGVDTPEELLA